MYKLSCVAAYSDCTRRITAPRAMPSSNAKDNLHPLVNIETRGRHRHNLDVPDAESYEESSPALSPQDVPRDLNHRQTMTVADYTTDLHPSSDNFEWVRDSL